MRIVFWMSLRDRGWVPQGATKLWSGHLLCSGKRRRGVRDSHTPDTPRPVPHRRAPGCWKCPPRKWRPGGAVLILDTPKSNKMYANYIDRFLMTAAFDEGVGEADGRDFVGLGVGGDPRASSINR